MFERFRPVVAAFAVISSSSAELDAAPVSGPYTSTNPQGSEYSQRTGPRVPLEYSTQVLPNFTHLPGRDGNGPYQVPGGYREDLSHPDLNTEIRGLPNSLLHVRVASPHASAEERAAAKSELEYREGLAVMAQNWRSAVTTSESLRFAANLNAGLSGYRQIGRIPSEFVDVNAAVSAQVREASSVVVSSTQRYPALKEFIAEFRDAYREAKQKLSTANSDSVVTYLGTLLGVGAVAAGGIWLWVIRDRNKPSYGGGYGGGKASSHGTSGHAPEFGKINTFGAFGTGEKPGGKTGHGGWVPP